MPYIVRPWIRMKSWWVCPILCGREYDRFRRRVDITFSKTLRSIRHLSISAILDLSSFLGFNCIINRQCQSFVEIYKISSDACNINRYTEQTDISPTNRYDTIIDQLFELFLPPEKSISTLIHHSMQGSAVSTIIEHGLLFDISSFQSGEGPGSTVSHGALTDTACGVSLKDNIILNS